MPFFHVYILRSLRDRRWYIGKTAHLVRRYRQHNLGQTKSTSYRRPLQLIYFESFLDERDASRRERYFKTSKGKTTLRQMLRCYLNDLQKDS